MNANKPSSEDDLPLAWAKEWRSDAIRKAQRAEEFWIGQQGRIRARMQSEGVRKAGPLWLVAVTAAAIFFAVLLGAPAGPQPPKAPAQTTLDADQELLLAVERALAAGTPEALQPLTLLVESSSNQHDVESISHKEHGHEN